MPQQKRRQSRMSSGKTSKLNKEKEEHRQLKFIRRAESGKKYIFEPNPFGKGTKEYRHEMADRAAKNTGRKTPIAKMRSIMAKLDNQLAKAQGTRKAIQSSKTR